jgi:dephospho-CoA kinase
MTQSIQNLNLICLTGGIATGKSKVGSWFASAGWDVICTDEIVHELYKSGGPLPGKIAQEFGPNSIKEDGDVNRKVLSEIVFNNPQALARLNEIVHPLVRQRWKEGVDSSIAAGRRVLVIIPLAYEVNVTQEFQQTWVVACSASEQLQRLQKRGISFTQAKQRIASQMPLQRKIDLADIVVWNNDSWTTTERQLKFLLNPLNEQLCDQR